MTIWFSSDHHFSHYNLLHKFKINCPSCGGMGDHACKKICDECAGLGEIPMRPFSSISQMDEQLIELHNARVQPQDHWWCLGDLTMKRGGRHDREWLVGMVKRMNGHKRLIPGNHDHMPTKVYQEAGFEKIVGSMKIDSLVCTHYPIHPNSIPGGCVNLHGHVHNNPGPSGRYINVSVEVINYAPVSLSELQYTSSVILKSVVNLQPVSKKE